MRSVTDGRNIHVSTSHPAASVWETGPQPGDRFEVEAIRENGRLTVMFPRELADAGLALERIEDETGRDIAFVRESDQRIIINGAFVVPQQNVDAIWLELAGDGRFRLVIDRIRGEDGARLADPALAVEFDPNDEKLLAPARRSASAAEVELSLRAARLATHAGFDRLICLPMVREMELLEHQVRTATTALRRMRGRAMLCDEVGLGKTVEAGLVLSELLMRGLVRSVLVLTPPSLIEQWQGEMRRKFSIELTSHDDAAFRELGPEAWIKCDRVIASIHTAKREPQRSAIVSRDWDIVIIDEAHHLRNRNTQVWKFASALRKQFILLLTATPVQNNLEELYNLVTLLEPGLLSTQRDFQRRFMSRQDKLTPRNVDEMHALLAEVMVRNRRSTVGLQFTNRWARTEAVSLGFEERRLYDDLGTFVRSELLRGREGGGVSRMTLIMLQMALGSSAQAAGSMLKNLLDKPTLGQERRDILRDLLHLAETQSKSAKADRLLGLAEEFPDKLVVFTQFRATQEMLYRRLCEAGIETSLFHGGLGRMEKEAAIERFRGGARVLLATESGSEGRNLQFAHGICNFDLPWNPMKIEQRIGRLSRIGQKRDVHVFNLVATGTVEAAVLHLLEAKLNMFELVIGEVDMILGNLEEDREFEDIVADLWAGSSAPDEFAARMEVLGNRLLAAKTAYFRQRAQDEKLFGSRFAPDA